MRSKNHYLYRPRQSGPWYFRKKDGKKETVFSLKTKDVSEARRLRDEYLLSVKPLTPLHIVKDTRQQIRHLEREHRFDEAETLDMVLGEILIEKALRGDDVDEAFDALRGVTRINEKMVDEYLNDFMSHLVKGTRQEYRTNLLKLKGIDIKSFSPEDAKNYVDELVHKYSGDTLVKRLSCYRTFWQRHGGNAAIWDGHRVKLRGIKAKQRQVVTPDQFDLALLEIRTHPKERDIRAFLEIARWTGCRRGVIPLIEINDKTAKTIKIPKAKSEDAHRVIPVSQFAWEWVEYMTHVRPSAACLKKGLFTRIGLDLHSFRHTVSSVCENCPPLVTKRFLGHKIKDLTFDRYGGKLNNTDYTPIIDALERYWLKQSD